MGGWAVCVPDLRGLDGLAIELVADVDAADRPLSGVSANQHVDSTPRPRGGELLIIDGLELRQSRTPLSRAHRAPAARPGPAAGTDLDPQRHRRRVHRRRAPAIQPGGRPASMPRRTTPSPTRCEWPGSETGRDLDRLRRRCLRGQTAAAPARHRRRSLQAIRQSRWASAQPPAGARTGTGTPITAGDPRRPSAPAMHPSPWRRPGGMTNCERHRRSAGQSAGTNTRYARPRWHRVAPQMPSRSAAVRAIAATSGCNGACRLLRRASGLIADYVLFVDLEGLQSEWYVIAGYGWLPVMSG